MPEIKQGSAVGNIKARLRMIVLYGIANSRNLLVLGTTNKTEMVLGYYTKWGDGAVDLEILADLYKDEVYAVGRSLTPQVPEGVLTKAPSADLYLGQTDEGEIGATYAEMDSFARVAGGDSNFALLDEEIQVKLIARVKANLHKGTSPPIPTVRESDEDL